MGRRHKKRIGATAQLIVGEDDDLIDWLNGLPDGTRNGVIKAALRLYAFNDATPPKFATQPRELETRPTIPADEFYAMRDHYEKFTRGVTSELDALRRELAESRANGVTPLQPDLVEAVDGIGEEKINQRKKKLKQAKW